MACVDLPPQEFHVTKLFEVNDFDSVSIMKLRSKIAQNILAPVKSVKEIEENSMAEDVALNSEEANDENEKLGPRWGPNHKGVQELAKLYGRGKIMQEYICFGLGLFLMFANFLMLAKYFRVADVKTLVVQAFFGILVADFFSGVVHWAADTWGTIEFPVFGKTLIRRFRAHHIDPTSITKNTVAKTNADTFAAISPVLIYLLARFVTWSEVEIQANIGWICFCFFFSVFASLSNQTHKWAHTYSGLPGHILFLQKLHVVLPIKHHRIHHVSPHDTYYCTTTGWCNWPLEILGFWEGLEYVIERLTGEKPRSDDLKWAQKR